MKIPDNLLKEVPLLTLLSYLILCFFRQPQVSDALIILGMVGLFAWKMYIEHNAKPTIEEQFKYHFEKFRCQVDEDTIQQNKKIERMQQDVGEFTRSFATFKGLTPEERMKDVKKNQNIRF